MAARGREGAGMAGRGMRAVSAGDSGAGGGGGGGMGPWGPLLVLVAMVVIGGVATHVLDVPAATRAFKAFVDHSPTSAGLVYVAVYVGAVVLWLPASVMTLGAGYLFGAGKGTALVSLASTLGATIAFFVSRYVARPLAGGALRRRFPKFAALDKGIERRGGFQLVLLLRLSPLFPFSALCYALGLTSVRLRDYVVASWIGMLPGTFAYVYFGEVGRSVADAVAGSSAGMSPGQLAVNAVGVAATVLATRYVTKLANEAQEGALDDDGDRGADELAPERQ